MADNRTNEVDGFDLEASTDRWRWAGLILMGLFFLAFPLFRFYEPSQRADARQAQVEFLAAEGAGLYEDSCASCHGPGGAGAIAPAIAAKEFLESVDDLQITQLIAIGVPGTEMIAYSNDLGGPLTSQEVTAITTYLRSLEEDAVSKPNWRTPLEDEDLTSNELFVLACSRCHGVDAEGIEDVGPDISQDSLTLMEADDWIIGRITDGYKLMPRFGRILTDGQITEIVTYLRFGDDPPPETTTTTTPSGTDTTEPDVTTTTAGGSPDTDDVLALGERLFQEDFSVDGCQECHAPDMKGSSDGPSIIGASRSGIATALRDVPDMEVETPLTSEEIEAIYAYMAWLRGGDATSGSESTSTTEATASAEELLAQGREIWRARLLAEDITGCQECHGRDGLGTEEAPDILGASRSSIVSALDGEVPDMNFEPTLTPGEIDAVYAYLQTLES